jgi:apolipoprotein D and lipocalin family protein
MDSNLFPNIFNNQGKIKNYDIISPKSPYDSEQRYQEEKMIVDNYHEDREYNLENNYIKTVDYVNLKKYSGLWYEIFRLPVPFENDPKNVTAEYTLNKDESINVLNSEIIEGRVISISGSAVPIDNTNSKLQIDFGNGRIGYYFIVKLGRNYEFSLVSSPDKKYAWLLSRTKDVSIDLLDELYIWMQNENYEVEKILITPQN